MRDDVPLEGAARRLSPAAEHGIRRFFGQPGLGRLPDAPAAATPGSPGRLAGGRGAPASSVRAAGRRVPPDTAPGRPGATATDAHAWMTFTGWELLFGMTLAVTAAFVLVTGAPVTAAAPRGLL
ncbi:hypothetical protein GCM10010116_30270 [Microbispora rosea subsp. aerata]|nr:hypothetical protein GCM10010116_30270 [Microbispora rosea subsp. aerata]GIH57509.1 hypothetical protein Mro02_44230 [Microbispora rosea subsp. aerata]GLJ85479.1 hypothetical protein GCM10017588_42120 [Microbispora rosea subsp. aerata]